jgi:hypothetical protein
MERGREFPGTKKPARQMSAGAPFPNCALSVSKIAMVSSSRTRGGNLVKPLIRLKVVAFSTDCRGGKGCMRHAVASEVKLLK